MAESHQEPNTELPMLGRSEIESELKILRDQVDLLQISTSERKKPWYKEINRIISVLALLLSGITFIYSQHSQNNEEIRSKKKELRETLAALIDLRQDFQTRISSITNPQVQEIENVNTNTKRTIQLEAADSLVAQIPEYVSWAEYTVLAYEHSMDSNFNKSERYFQEAIDVANTSVGKISSLRALAIFYFSQNPLRDYNKGRKYFSEALDVVKNPADPYLIYLLGYTYEQWGLYELWNGFQMEGNQMIERARKYYSDLPLNNKKQALDSLTYKVNQISQPTQSVQPQPLKQGN